MPSEAVISADSHIQEPPELFLERLPKKFRHLAPRLEKREDGSRYMHVEGRRPRRVDIAEARESEDDQNREFRNDPSGGRDIDRRIEDQVLDGVCAEVLYPNTSLHLYKASDPEFQLAQARAYNDWLMEIFSDRLDKFVPVAVCPVADIDKATVEVLRVKKLGYRSIKIPITINERPYNLPQYESFWSACEEAGIVVSFHAFTNSEDAYPEDWGEEEGVGGALNMMAMAMVDGMSPVAQLISGGVLMRHPQLEFVVVECGAGWLAWLLYVLDEQYGKKHMWVRPKLDLQPSEYFARQGHVTFSDDPMALRLLDFTGADKLMWGSDYPHDEGTFPHSREVIERTFVGVSDEAKDKIVRKNAAALYGIDVGSLTQAD